jgi:hypothetical protein
MVRRRDLLLQPWARDAGAPLEELERSILMATRLIKDGQRIRVHGREGFVEILE